MTFDELSKIYVNLREIETMCSIWRQQLQDEISKLPEDKQDELEDVFIKRFSQVQGLSPGKIKSRWKTVEQAIRNLSDPEDVMLFIENKESSDPYLLACFSKQHFVVDIIKSVKEDITNLGHPLVIWFIKEYARACKSPTLKIPNSEIAQKVISKICKALTKVEVLSLNSPRYYWLKYYAWPIEYFEKAVQIHTEINVIRNSSEKRRKIREGLQEFPDLDHTKMIEFLEIWYEPRQVTIQTLRNAFLAYIEECEVQTIKNRLTEANKARRELDPHNLVSEESMQKFNDSGEFDVEIMQLLFGIGIIHSEDEITKSKLIWKERTFEFPNSVSSTDVPA